MFSTGHAKLNRFSLSLSIFAVPASAPDRVRVLVHNSTLAEIHWEPVSASRVNGRLQGYKVVFDTVNANVQYLRGKIQLFKISLKASRADRATKIFDSLRFKSHR